jgi:hypothetical protein
MPSKLVLDREKSTRSVVASSDTHADALHAAVSRELSPHLDKGESLPDIALFARLVGRKLKADMDRLIEADRAHELELSDDSAPREARDGAAEKVRSALVDLRDAVSTAYGVAGLKKLSLSEAISVDPAGIASKAQTTLDALRDDTIKLPKSRRASLKVDRKGFADEIAAELPVLVKALGDVAREESEAKVTQAAKNEAMSAHNRGFSRSAGLLEVLALYGGLDEIAARMRPSVRRPGRTAAEEEEPPAADPAGNDTPPVP